MAVPVQLAAAEAAFALEHDSEFFIQFFLGDELTFPVPVFHKDIFHLMVALEIARIVCAIPRDHAKTTLAKLACVWYFLFSDYRFIVYLSNTSGIAIPATNDIVNFLKSENFVATFGHCEWLVEQDGKGLYKFRLPQAFGNKLCILRALGAGQQVRGINVDNQRPQLAVIDDLEDNDNIATPELFLKLKKWMYGPFRKCLDKFHNKMIWLGNMISQNSMLYENCESDFWYSRRYGCLLSSGNALWPDAWSIEKLMQDYLEYQEAGMADVWFAEMMNLPMASGSGLIEAEDITYKPEIMPRDHKLGFITVDLAISEQKWAHKQTIVIHIWVDEEFWQIPITYECRTNDPVALFYELVQIANTWGIYTIGIESVAYQASLQYVFPHLCLIDGIEGFTFVPLPATGRKVERLAGWAGLLKKGEYCLTEGDFHITRQVLEYNPAKKHNKDDTIDACANGPYMIANHWDLIWAAKHKEEIEQQVPQSVYQLEAQRYGATQDQR